jgi:hypothetical protein|nr:hypothetical protein [uncultured Acetatifactor sp.]
MDILNSLAARHKSGIFALKILEIKEDGRAVVKHPLKKNTCVLLSVPDSGFCEPGLYIDVQFIPNDEFMPKYKAVYQGITLPEFVPEDGAEIY